MDLNTRLRQHMGLTPTDQCLRDYILRYPEKTARMNTRQLAEASYTSPAAVVRFCRKFGYQGLQEFKADFFSTLPDTPAFDLPDGDFPFDAGTDTETLIRSILKLEEGTLRRLGASLTTAALDRAAGMLVSASVLDLCGIGTNRFLLEEFGFRLMKYGFRVNDAANTVNLSYIANQMDASHCLVLASYSGANEQIGHAIRHARAHGTPILLITAHADSPAAHMADCLLSVPMLESDDDKISTFSSAIATKAVLDLLFAKLFQDTYESNLAFAHEDAARLSVRRTVTFSEALASPEAPPKRPGH